MRKLALLLLLLARCAHAGEDPDALWKIVSQKCVPEQQAGQPPAPCASVDLARGMVVLKDRDGATQYLVIPTAKVTGIEDPAVLNDGASMVVGWETRPLVEAKLGHALPRDAVSLAVNSVNARSQNQLHVHVDCLDGSVRTAIQGLSVGTDWAPLPVSLMGDSYIARRVPGETLAGVNPYRLLADKVGGPIAHWSIAVVGATMPDGGPGFVLLATEGPTAHAEELQDHSCRGY